VFSRNRKLKLGEMIRTRQALLSLTCCLLTWQSLLAQDVPTKLSLVVVQGEGAANRAGGRAALNPSVRVEDQDNRPIRSAVVVFTLPTSGASGEFEGGGKTVTVVSDDKGVAAVHGLKLNDVTGTMQILVNVAYRGQTASAVITEFTVAPNGVSHGKSTGKWVAILALVGGGAAGAVFATRKSSASNSSGGSPSTGPGTGSGAPATIVLTIGSSSVGAPHP
jgi:hypothetical protein